MPEEVRTGTHESFGAAARKFDQTRWGVFSPEERTVLMMALEDWKEFGEWRVRERFQGTADEMAGSLATYLGDK